MANIDTLKNYLQITDTSIDTQLQLLLDFAETEYLSRTHQEDADDNIVIEMAIEKYGQYGNEGIASMNYSGISEVFNSDYSERITRLLRSKTRMIAL